MTIMFCTKYALTKGITGHRGELITSELFAPEGWSYTPWEVGKDVHETRTEAVAAAEKMRKKKIANLEKQLDKLRKMTFYD